MSENIAQTVQKVIQDLVAPEVKELKVLVSALQKQIDQRFEGQNQSNKAEFKALDANIRALDQKSDMQFQALMSAFGEFKAQSELTSIRIISQLSERVAILEAQRH